MSGEITGSKIYVRNSLYVKNLSPNITETIVREFFCQFDTIDRVLFRTFKPTDEGAPLLPGQFFAQIDFRNSKGVAEGSRLTGTKILGVPCECSVIDPTQIPQAIVQQESSGLDADDTGQPQGVQAEYFKKKKDEYDNQLYRTVHVAGVQEGVTGESLEKFFETHFGAVGLVRVDKDPEGVPFALVEFRDRHIAQRCRAVECIPVDGKWLVFSKSKTIVDSVALAESSVHFDGSELMPENPLTQVNFLAGETVLGKQAGMLEKLAKVKAAAAELADAALGPDKKKKKKEKKESARSDSERRKEDEDDRDPLGLEKLEKSAGSTLALTDATPQQSSPLPEESPEEPVEEEEEEEEDPNLVDVDQLSDKPLSTPSPVEELDSEMEVVDCNLVFGVQTDSSGSESLVDLDSGDDRPAKAPREFVTVRPEAGRLRCIRSGATIRCTASKGIAYRATRDLEDKRTDVVGPQHGEIVRVEERVDEWVRTKIAWLPLYIEDDWKFEVVEGGNKENVEGKDEKQRRARNGHNASGGPLALEDHSHRRSSADKDRKRSRSRSRAGRRRR